MENMFEITLRRKNAIVLEKGTSTEPKLDMIGAIVKNISSFGYCLDKNVIEVIKTYNEKELVEFYNSIYGALSYIVGNVKHKPMYPNFPQQVMEADIVELYINAIIHYASCGSILPEYEKVVRFPLFEDTNIKTISLMSNKNLSDMFMGIIASKIPFSSVDKENVECYFNSCKNINIPDSIPCKENMAFVIKSLCNKMDIFDYILPRFVKTSTDVLRIAAALSDSDVSLSEKVCFRNFSRKERKTFLAILSRCSCLEEDMLKNKGLWITFAEKLHPGEYANNSKYQRACAAFDTIRNNKQVSTFNSKVENYITSGDYNKAIELLSKRPGIFARKLDLLIRKSDDPISVINAFNKVAPRVDNKVLLQVKNHFKYRNDDKTVRAFMPKGNIQKAMTTDVAIDNIEDKYCSHIVSICDNALISSLTNKDFLGNIYIADELKNYSVPFGNRSSSKSSMPLSRGTKLSFDKDNILRTFCYWKNGRDRVDIDLSVSFFNDSFTENIGHVSYTNIRNSFAVHSGDIVDAPTGASEFIDIDVKKAREKGVKYAVIQLFNFSGDSFTECSECFMGWMNRKSQFSGEIYEPKTVQNKVDLLRDATSYIPLIIDIENNKVIWADLFLIVAKGESELECCHNIEENIGGTVLSCKAIAKNHFSNLYDLLALNAKARGVLVEDKEDADVIFDDYSKIDFSDIL